MVSVCVLMAIFGLPGPVRGGGLRQDWGYPRVGPGQDGLHPRTGYAAGGTPLSVKQEDFLVYLLFHLALTLHLFISLSHLPT